MIAFRDSNDQFERSEWLHIPGKVFGWAWRECFFTGLVPLDRGFDKVRWSSMRAGDLQSMFLDHMYYQHDVSSCESSKRKRHKWSDTDRREVAAHQCPQVGMRLAVARHIVVFGFRETKSTSSCMRRRLTGLFPCAKSRVVERMTILNGTSESQQAVTATISGWQNCYRVVSLAWACYTLLVDMVDANIPRTSKSNQIETFSFGALFETCIWMGL